MKQLLTVAALASGTAAPILATPADAFMFGILLCSAAVGTALIGRTFSGDTALHQVTPGTPRAIRVSSGIKRS